MPVLGTRAVASGRGFGQFGAAATVKVSAISTNNGHIWVKDGNFAYNSTSGINYTNLFSSQFSSNAYLVMRSIVTADGSIVVAGSMTRFTCCGVQGKLRILRSVDKGVSWSVLIDGNWGAYDAFGEVRLVYGNGYYWLAGSNTIQYYSTTGASWTSFTPVTPLDSRYLGIINSRWIAGNANGGNNYRYNDSAIPTTAWTAATGTLNLPYDSNNLAYGGAANGLAFGFGNSSNRFAYVYSTNGSSWTGASTPYGYQGKYIGWNNVTNSHWVIFNIPPGESGDAVLYTTTNGTTWTQQSLRASSGNMVAAQYQAWGYMYFSDQATPLPVAAMHPWDGGNTPPRAYVGGSWQEIALSPTMSSLSLFQYQVSSINSNKYPYGFQATP